MIERFQGDGGRSVLLTALREQPMVRDELALAEALAGTGTLRELKMQERFISQNAADNDIFFILTGRVSVCVNGREVAQRSANQHVGEMTLIDPSARRSADVIAIEESVVLQLSEAAFSKLAQQWPRMWRVLAVEIANRLRQRGRLVAARNEIPRLFIGSSAEGLAVARAIQDGLAHEQLVTTIWTDNVFGASHFPLEDLENQISTSDFAALVLSPDDVVISREEKNSAPRDNVVFELGLSMGALLHRRVFLVSPRGKELKIPTDLLGLTPLQYSDGKPEDIAARLGPTCNAIRKRVVELGAK
jgi:CRP/FNR family cyclic AMP-dependent transcriptional regulator